ncbi:MAG: hypothetical protein K0S31_4766 [Sphingobacterium multivorum]|jgi:hypothetical protein|nr:hypothetical protein [Sphingobacterium multivorum]
MDGGKEGVKIFTDYKAYCLAAFSFRGKLNID